MTDKKPQFPVKQPPSRWILHVKNVRKAYEEAGHPLSYQQALVIAKQTYNLPEFKDAPPSQTSQAIPILPQSAIPAHSAPVRKPRIKKEESGEELANKFPKAKKNQKAAKKKIVYEEEESSSEEEEEVIVLKKKPKPQPKKKKDSC